MTSLIARLRLRPSGVAWSTFRTILLAASLGLLADAAIVMDRARRLDAATARLPDAGAAAVARLAAERAAAAFARPTLEAVLARLGARLPPDTMVVAIGRGEGGRGTLLLDTADPAAVRAVFRRDGWLARWRERGEEPGEDGRYRMTFETLADAG